MDTQPPQPKTLDIIQTMPHRYEVHLTGDFEVADAELLGRRFAETVGDVRAEKLQVIMDLTGLEACSVAARETLCQFQMRLASYGARTTYVAHKSRFRGVGLWVAHNSKDQNVRTVHNKAQAEKWLNDSKSRFESVAARLGMVRKRWQSPERDR